MTKETKQYDGSTMLTGAYCVLREAFVDNILAGMVQYVAYKEAGYSPNQTNNAAMASSTALLRNPKVKARLDYKRKELAKETGLSVELVVNELKRLAFLPDTDENVRPKQKLTALDMLSKHLGLFEKDNEQKRESIFDILAIVGLNADLTSPVASQGLNSGDMPLIEGKTDE